MNRCNFNKIKIGNNTFQERLIIPLWIRAVESKKDLPLLIDRKACEIFDTVDFNFTSSLVKPSEIEIISHLSIFRIFDDIINKFIISNPNGIIVNIGCGIDTYYERAINNSLNWFELDLPEVIDFRKLLINETNNRKFIAGSILDTYWFKQVKPDAKVLFIASGLFGYYCEDIIKDFVIKVVNNFPSAELLFDIESGLGAREVNRNYKRLVPNKVSYLKWVSKNRDVFLSWDNRLCIKSVFPIYKHVSNGLSLKNRILGSFSDMLNCKYVVHLIVN